jgi:hypothetical protein
LLRHLETTLEFMYNCRKEVLWRRPLQFRIKFNSLLPVSTVHYLIVRPRKVA